MVRATLTSSYILFEYITTVFPVPRRINCLGGLFVHSLSNGRRLRTDGESTRSKALESNFLHGFVATAQQIDNRYRVAWDFPTIDVAHFCNKPSKERVP